jgi:subtilase family serine protease
MDRLRTSARLLAAFGIIAQLTSSVVVAQTSPVRRALITQSIDETQLVTLAGNMRPEMTPANDRGAVSDSLVLEMYLQLNRAPEVQQAMDELVNQLHDPQSPQYHKWLTADQIAAQYGPAEADIQTVTQWLESQGFTVNVIYRANGVIDFSGPASAIREAFHTEIHGLEVNGRAHMANASDPKLPAALTEAIHGVVSLNNFRPHPMNRPQYTYPCPINAPPGTCFPPGGTSYVVVPDDLYTIYDMNPIYAAGITGKGQTIVVLEDSDLYTTADWYTFRSTFGLAQRFPHGSLTQIHPQSPGNQANGETCIDPGVNADDGEAALDVEWSSVAAPDAAIVAAACASVDTNFQAGAFIALQNIVTGHVPAPGVISISWGEGETEGGATYNSFIYQLYEIAVMQGVSLFVSTGDSGADGDYADYLSGLGEHGINVNGEASTPFNVAVGGTDFADTYFGQNSTYWSPTNGKYFNSALSYIPEIPWNTSCAGELFTKYFGFSEPYGVNGFCNSSVTQTLSNGYPPTAGDQFAIAVAGSGGPSACAYGTSSIPGVVSGTCRGYQKPLYQNLVRGNPRDGVRDLPDVSLLAANGLWYHFYVFCYSDPTPGYYGFPCVGAPGTWAGGGGTSFSAPIMAGIQALINQATGDRQGNPDFIYYALAAVDYDFGGTGCNATLGNRVDPHCIFHDVTLGDNDVACLPLTDSNGVTIGTFNCYIPSGINGVMSLSNTSYEPAYTAKPGWDFATGLGSVDAYNLVKAWPGSRLH